MKRELDGKYYYCVCKWEYEFYCNRNYFPVNILHKNDNPRKKCWQYIVTDKLKGLIKEYEVHKQKYMK